MFRKAQHTVEFAMVVGMVMLALSAMNLYIKRGLQGRYKQFADAVYKRAPTLGRQSGQYEPFYLYQKLDVERESQDDLAYNKSTDTFEAGSYAETVRSGKRLQLPYNVSVEKLQVEPGPWEFLP